MQFNIIINAFIHLMIKVIVTKSLGLTLMETKLIDQAIWNFNKAIELNTKFSEAYNNKGMNIS